MLKRLAQIELAISIALLAAITGLVFLAAITRFFGHPIIWSVDMAQLLFIWLCFFGASRAMREKSHLGTEMLVRYLGARRQFLTEVVCTFVILAFLGVLIVEGAKLTLLNRERVFSDSTLSYAWVTAAVPVGCTMIGAALLYNLAAAWRRRKQGALVYTRTPADGDAPPALEL